MKVLIYSNSSFGGCFEYAKQIAQTFAHKSNVEECHALFPKGVNIKEQWAKPILLKDKIFSRLFKIIGKFYFVYRSYINPKRAYKYAMKNNIDLFIFNDFDQITAKFWTPIFKKRNFKTAIILHDPDRTAYFKSKRLSESTMQSIMNIMDMGFYHEKLPTLPYYNNSNKTIYAKIPHGIYPAAKPDEKIEQLINQLKANNTKVVSITGNIRAEKNYKLAIEAIKYLQNTKLIIAGRTVTNTENINDYINFAINKGVQNNVIFIDKYLNNSEMSAIFKYSDIVLLYYSKTFKSQSGILNSLAPFKPKLIVSDIESGMTESCKQFYLAQIVKPDNLEALIEAIKNFPKENPHKNNWDTFANYSSWERNVNIQISTYKKTINE